MKDYRWLFLLLFVGCSSSKEDVLENYSTCELPAGTVVLCGQEGLPIRFDRVVTDSRCPLNAQCVWEGAVEVAISVGEESVRLALHPGKPEAAMATVGRHTIRLLTVDPYPVTGEEIDPDDYVLGLAVN